MPHNAEKNRKQVVQAARGSAHENDFTVKRTKAQIERFPALDENVLEDKRKIEDYDKLFRSSWTTGPSTRKPATSSRLSSFQNEIVETAAKSRLTSGHFGERAPIFRIQEVLSRVPCSGLRGQYQVAVGRSVCDCFFVKIRPSCADAPPLRCKKDTSSSMSSKPSVTA